MAKERRLFMKVSYFKGNASGCSVAFILVSSQKHGPRGPARPGPSEQWVGAVRSRSLRGGAWRGQGVVVRLSTLSVGTPTPTHPRGEALLAFCQAYAVPFCAHHRAASLTHSQHEPTLPFIPQGHMLNRCAIQVRCRINQNQHRPINGSS